MAALDFLRGWRDRVNKRQREIDKSENKEYRFTASFFDENTLYVKNEAGIVVSFRFPSEAINLAEYDSFIQQMQDKEKPLPSIRSIRSLIVAKSVIQAEDQPGGNPNTDLVSITTSIEELARKHGLSVAEMSRMYEFAQVEFYKRYKARLRDKKLEM